MDDKTKTSNKTGNAPAVDKGSSAKQQKNRYSRKTGIKSKQPKEILVRNQKNPVEGGDAKTQRTKTVLELANLKGKRNIVGLTAYDSLMGKLVSDAGVDFILVGDSVGTTILGYPTTIPVTIEDMIHHTSAVRRANPECLLVADLPFGEASLSFDRLLDSARRLMQVAGADAVKIEGGKDVADDIEKLVATGIPVLGHIGLLPQTVKAIGGYRKFGSKSEEADSLCTDAIALEEAGCFSIVGEMIEEEVAREISRQVLPPLIGIGSGEGCDGQILVTTDLLGYSNSQIPSFVKPRINLSQKILLTLSEYVQEVRSQKPSAIQKS